ncbi:hypothetical protein M3Y95_00843500 [Aphelenchoides besseyi]|nr:hypothetical protein M3Y95_00843500 [Aphelenchoides besseyi]
MGNVLYFVSKEDETPRPQSQKTGQLEINVAKSAIESVQQPVTVSSNSKTNRPNDTSNLVSNQRQQKIANVKEVIEIVLSDDEDEVVCESPKLDNRVSNCFTQSSPILKYVSQPPVLNHRDFQFISHTYRNIGLKCPFEVNRFAATNRSHPVLTSSTINQPKRRRKHPRSA